MLIDTRLQSSGPSVAILGYGRTKPQESDLFDTGRFVREFLSDAGRERLCTDLGVASEAGLAELIARAEAKFVDATGIFTRCIYPGRTTTDLGSEAARDCLNRAQVDGGAIDAIIAATNTGRRYPSLADDIKLAVGAPASALACSVEEACVSGMVAMQLGWSLVRTGFRRVLVVAAEKATQLAAQDEWFSSNLFGDAAGAVLLGPGERDSFIGFDVGSDPYDGRLELIVDKPGGFVQQGSTVHKYVGTQVPGLVLDFVRGLGLDPSRINHLVPHQPSVKTLDLFQRVLARQCPDLRPVWHSNLREMGNTSSASTLWLLARAVERGEIKPGDIVLMVAFGSGMSWGFTLVQY